MLLFGAAACAQNTSGSVSSTVNPWTDPRLVKWSGEMNQGQFDQVLREVEADLVSPVAHPFDIDIWCRLHLRQHDLDQTASALTSPALKQALGVSPRIYSLYYADRVGELARLRKSLSPDAVHEGMTSWLLEKNAKDATDFDAGLTWALYSLRHHEVTFINVWITLNLVESDLRVRHRLNEVLASDAALAATPAGRSLAALLRMEDSGSTFTNCRDQDVGGDREFVQAARAWLALYPGDSVAYLFALSHEGDLNSDRPNMEADINSALANYPLLHVGSGIREMLRADFLTTKDDDAGRALASRWKFFESSVLEEQRAMAATLASSVLREMTNCGASRRDSTARQWVDAALASTPPLYQAPLLAEQAELDMEDANDLSAPARAVVEARRALAIKDDDAATTRLLRALIHTKKDADAAEGLQIYHAALTSRVDHSESFFDWADSLLLSSGTCHDREQNWRAALVEFPNASSALEGIAKAQLQCSEPEAASTSLSALFTLTDPWAGSLTSLQALWFETDGLTGVDVDRSKLFQTRPRFFTKLTSPQPLLKASPASAIEHRRLQLVPQVPPVSQLNRMTQSSDGTLLAVAESDGVVMLWSTGSAQTGPGKVPALCDAVEHTSRSDAACPHLLRRFIAHTGALDDLQFSPDGHALITASRTDGLVRLFDVESGGELWHIQTKPGGDLSIAIHHLANGTTTLAILIRQADPTSGNAIPVAGWSSLALCSLDATSPCATMNWYSNARFGAGSPGALAWSADGNRLAARVSNVETLLIDTSSRKLLRPLSTAAGAVFNPDLSAELYTEGGLTLKASSLTDGAKPVTVAQWTGHLLDKRLFANGVAYFAIEGPASAPKPSDSDSESSPPSPLTIQIFATSVPASATDKTEAAKLIASFPSSQYPDPVLRFSTSVDDRFTVFSSENTNSLGALRAFAAGQLVPTASNGLVLERLPARMPPIPNSLAFTSDGRELLVGRGASQNSRVDVWDLAEQGERMRLTKNLAVGSSVAVQGSDILTCSLTGSGTYKIVRYDLHTLRPAEIPSLVCDQDGAFTTSSTDGGVAWTQGNDDVMVMASGTPQWETGSLSGGDKVVALSSNGKLVVAATTDDIFAIEKGNSPRELCGTENQCPSNASFSSLSLSNDGRYAAAAIGPSMPHTVPAPGPEYGVLVVDLISGTQRLQADSSPTQRMAVTAVAFAPNSSRFASGTADGRVTLADAGDPTFSRPVLSMSSPVAAITFSNDGRLLAAALESGSVVLFHVTEDAQTTEIAQLNSFDDGDWSVVNPNTQQYDASNAGRLNELLWVYGTSTIELDQMLPSYYRARLLPKLLGFDTTGLAASPRLDPEAIDLPPTVRITAMSPELVLTSDHPINWLTRVSVFVNNTLVPASNLRVTPDGLLHVSLDTLNAYAKGQENQISVKTSNEGNTMESRGFHQKLQDTSVAVAPQPKQFYAIIAGISHYGTGDLDSLPLADGDARDMAMAVVRGATHLVGNDPSRVHLYLLTSDKQAADRLIDVLHAAHLGTAEWMAPTHADFLSAFQQVAAAKLHKDDIFLMFLAGHGLIVKDTGTPTGAFAFPTAEITSATSPPAGTYLSAAELQKGVLELHASHTVLMFDTCNSGEFLATSGLQLEQANKLNATIDSSAYILTGAAAGASAFDDPTIGHGFLTAGLLISMREQLDLQELSASKWLQGAAMRTGELARFRGHSQVPINLGSADPLEVANLPKSELICIPDLSFAPLVRRPTLVDKNGNGDDQNLNSSIVHFWHSEEREAVLPPGMISDDGNSPETHVEVGGNYVVENDEIVVNLTLRYGAKHINADPIHLPFINSDNGSGPSGLDGVAKAIALKIESYAPALAASSSSTRAAESCPALAASPKVE